MIAEYVEEKLSHDGERVVPIGKFDQMSVAIVDRLTEIREIIFASSLSFDLTSELEKEGRLADQVESDVRERDVLFENRPVSAPLRQTMTKNETIVAESEEIFGECGGVGQKPFSPRGILWNCGCR